GRDFHMTEHEYHSQHQGGGLARACASEDSGDRAVAEDHGPLFVGRRTDHTGLHRLAYAQAHRLDLRVIDCHPGRPVDALAGWFTGLGTWFRRFSRRPRLRFPDGLDALLRVRHGPAPKQYRTLLRTQMGGCARETTRQRSGNEQFVALDGRKHDDQPNIEYVVDMVRVFVAWLGAGVLIWTVGRSPVTGMGDRNEVRIAAGFRNPRNQTGDGPQSGEVSFDLSVTMIESRSQSPNMYQSSPIISDGCCVLPAPLPQARDSAEQ